MSRSVRRIMVAFALVSAQSALSQQINASIQGTVTDPTSAPVAGATVTVKDLDRGSIYTGVTNGDGFYNVPRIGVGRYQIRAESKGFQTAVKGPVTLEMNQTARIDFNMVIGQVTETVEVTGAAELLQTEST